MELRQFTVTMTFNPDLLAEFPSAATRTSEDVKECVAKMFSAFNGLPDRKQKFTNILHEFDNGNLNVNISLQALTAEEAMEEVITYSVKPPIVNVTTQFHRNVLTLSSMEEGNPIGNPFLGAGEILFACDSCRRVFSEKGFSLLWAVENNRLVLVTGAGASFSLTNNNTSKWEGFLDALVGRLWPRDNPGDKFKYDRFTSLDEHSRSEYVYKVASEEGDNKVADVTRHIFSIMSSLQPDNGDPATGTLDRRTPWTRALGGFAGPILTFNYDTVLEHAITRAPANIADLNLKSSELERLRYFVLHMHGIFTHDQSIVLCQESYLKAAKYVPSFLKTLAAENFVFLYVGVNGILKDPDMGLFWQHEGIQHCVGNRRFRQNHFVFQRTTASPSTNALPRDVRGNEFGFFSRIQFQQHDEIPLMIEALTTKSFFAQLPIDVFSV